MSEVPLYTLSSKCHAANLRRGSEAGSYLRLIDSRRRRVCDVGNGQDFVCYDQQGLEVGVSGFSFWGSGHNASVAPALHLLERSMTFVGT